MTNGSTEGEVGGSKGLSSDDVKEDFDNGSKNNDDWFSHTYSVEGVVP